MNNCEKIKNSFQMKWWESLSLDEQKGWLKIFSENLKLELNIKTKPTPKEISPKTKEDIQRWKRGNIDIQIEDKFDEFEYSEGC